ncbi:sulfotransferase family protein [Roseovarius sp. SCSIO 43702]|uniref:sulfotransferase family 2 domain-containing protein n=1 Tax=Roseovarius sp. SCSIO 43702 TaxID=2823043 RepID=UPI001C734547|nr:sulfotransferase family 2 domain-containing protein [Roseovarius sp. SCSIO 43702]QYX56946.1 sulfotransferase family protein [Roseovarius sp. SCSIO 43702]
MTARFDYFVLFAEMRTGSNLLEANLNAFEGFQCHGEAFNPHFIGYPNTTEILGVTQAMREGDPERLIKAIRERSEGLGGFRYFHDHDPRVLDICLDDPRCAKIILNRNPAESYVSLKIARETGQWKLTNVKRRRDARVVFEADEFDDHIQQLQEFQRTLMRRLQVTGQTAFHINYDDLNDLDIINGLARFLGSDERLETLDSGLKIQNPEPLSEKVSNFEEMEKALAGLDMFNLSRTPDFEPRRGPAVPGFYVGLRAPLIFMPVRGGPEHEVTTWLAALDGIAPEDLPTRLAQKELRKWKRQTPLHRSFTVLRHPVARAHHTFCNRILSRGAQCFPEIRRTMRNFHKLPIPGSGPDEGYDRRAHRAAFLAYLEIIKANLRGQTGFRVDAAWATQSSVVTGMANFILPDMILREEEMAETLPALARALGHDGTAPMPAPEPDEPFSLAEIYDEEIEAAVTDIYQKDYVMFGFGPWA